MREYSTLSTQFWLDVRVQTLSSDARYLLLYCLTGPHSTALGCFRLPRAYIAEDLGWPP